MRSEEEWRPVVGYEGLYSVSNFGQVRSEGRMVQSRPGRTRHQKAFIRSLKANHDGYMVLNLCKDGRSKMHRVHVIVAAAFLGPKPDGCDVAHNDGQPSINHLSNLRYDTRSGNLADRARHGTLNFARGEKNGFSKLTEAQARLIQSSTLSGPKLAEMFGIGRGCANRIRSGQAWKHLQAVDM